MAGKGSAPRPYSVDRKTFEDNWDRIFKNRQKQHDQEKRAKALDELTQLSQEMGGYFDKQEKRWGD